MAFLKKTTSLYCLMFFTSVILASTPEQTDNPAQATQEHNDINLPMGVKVPNTQPAEYIIAFTETEQLPVEEVKIEFEQKDLNTLTVDPNSSKSPLEQFLDTGYRSANLKTPYRDVLLLTTLVNAENKNCNIAALYPHRFEIPSEYAAKMHKNLKNSTLLAAAAYVQLYETEKDGNDVVVDLNKHGLWKCREHECNILDTVAIRHLVRAYSDLRQEKRNLWQENDALKKENVTLKTEKRS